MFRALRVLFFGSAFAALVALGGHALARWCGQAGAWQVARELLTEARRGEALDSREEASRRYSQAKHAITDEVIAGRLSLTEAAERFGQLGDLLDGQQGLIAPYKGLEGEEALCGNVIVWVASVRTDDPARQARVRACLEAEYRERFGDEPPEPGWGAPGPGPLSTEVRAPARRRHHRWRGEFTGPPSPLWAPAERPH